MGKFDGILICSDWDGTLYAEDGVPQKNIDAINYFEREGGLFTISTGRHSEYLKMHISGFEINTYTISINGALIINEQNGDILYEGFFDESSLPLVKKIDELAEGDYYISVFYKDAGTVARTKIRSVDEYLSLFEQYPIYKVVYSSSLESVLKTRDKVTEAGLGDYIFIRSWETGIELIKARNSKGIGAQRVKEHCGCHLLIAVGNYENDIDMFAAADISYAVSNACEAAKNAATRITVSDREGAIAAIIEEIETDLCSAYK